MLPLECCSEAHVDLHAVVRGGWEEDCQAGVPVQAVFARAFRVEQQSESTLVREHSNPVGSAETIYINVLYIVEQKFENLALCFSPYTPD